MDKQLWEAVKDKDYEKCCRLISMTAEETDAMLYKIGEAQYNVVQFHDTVWADIDVVDLILYDVFMQHYLRSRMLDIPPLARYGVRAELQMRHRVFMATYLLDEEYFQPFIDRALKIFEVPSSVQRDRYHAMADVDERLRRRLAIIHGFGNLRVQKRMP